MVRNSKDDKSDSPIHCAVWQEGKPYTFYAKKSELPEIRKEAKACGVGFTYTLTAS